MPGIEDDNGMQLTRRTTAHQRANDRRDESDDAVTPTTSDEPVNVGKKSNIGVALLTGRRRKLRLIQSVVRSLGEYNAQQQIWSGDERRANANVCPQLFSRIRALALSSGGLICDEHRKKLWPILAQGFADLMSDEDRPATISQKQLITDCDQRSDVSAGSSHCDSLLATPSTSSLSLNLQDPTLEDLREHVEWRQVELDVKRTLARFPSNIDDEQREKLQQQLVPLIVRIMYDNADYQYYQGFHDICLTFLVVMGEKRALIAANQVSSCGIFRQFLCEPLEESAPRLIHLIYVILRQTDIELETFLRRAELGHMFGLSWLLTWYAHSLDDYEHVVRLYDLFLASHYLMPVYFGASLVLYRGSEILDNCEPEMPYIHALLTRIKPKHFPLEALITDALDLFQQYPPTMLTGQLAATYDKEVREEAVARQHARSPGHGGYGMSPRARPFSPRQMVPLMSPNLRHNALSATVWALTATAAAAWYFYAHSDATNSWNNIF